VFNVEREEHASRIARKEIGQRLADIPLKVLEVAVLDDGDAEDGRGADDAGTADSDSTEPATDGDVLPEFDELLEE
jgi:hypothetical protein